MDTRIRHVHPTWWQYRRKKNGFNSLHGQSHTVLLLLNREFTLPVYPTAGIPMKPADPTLSQQGSLKGGLVLQWPLSGDRQANLNQFLSNSSTSEALVKQYH